MAGKTWDIGTLDCSDYGLQGMVYYLHLNGRQGRAAVVEYWKEIHISKYKNEARWPWEGQNRGDPCLKDRVLHKMGRFTGAIIAALRGGVYTEFDHFYQRVRVTAYNLMSMNDLTWWAYKLLDYDES